ncbi:MAG: replication protein [Promethearchaeota archaeon]
MQVSPLLLLITMANPQKENGYTPIANEIMEALAKINLSSYQFRLLMFILRKTYGFNKKDDWISNSQIVGGTGIRKQHVSRTKKELMERKLVTLSGNKIKFNKDCSQWCELPRQVTVTNIGDGVTYPGSKVTSSGEHKRKYTKETYTKDSNSKKPIKIEKGIDVQYDKFVDFCESRKLTVQIGRGRYMEMREEYKMRIPWWTEVQKCINWCYDNNKRFVTTSRLRNWISNAIKFLKEKEIKQLQESQSFNHLP